MPDHADLNPFVPEVLEDPYAVYAELRCRGVYQVPHTTMFLITRFRDVEHVLMHPEVFSVHGLTEGLTRDTPELRAIEAQGWPAVDVLSKADPPAHTGYRSVVNRSFSAQSVKQLEPRLHGRGGVCQPVCPALPTLRLCRIDGLAAGRHSPSEALV